MESYLIAQAVLVCARGQRRHIQDPPGRCYHLDARRTKAITASEIDRTSFNALLLSIRAFCHHSNLDCHVLVYERTDDDVASGNKCRIGQHRLCETRWQCTHMWESELRMMLAWNRARLGSWSFIRNVARLLFQFFTAFARITPPIPIAAGRRFAVGIVSQAPCDEEIQYH
jgi:hypothetical protein